MIDYILYLIGYIFCLTNMTWIYGQVNNKEFKVTILRILLIIFFSVLSVIFLGLEIVLYRMLISILLIVILVIIFYKDDLKKTIFYTFLIWAIGMLLDMLFMMLFSFSLTIISVSSKRLHYFATYILQLLYHFLAKRNFFKLILHKTYKLFNKINFYLIFILTIALVYMGYKGVLSLYNFNKFIIIFVLSFLALIIFFETLMIIYLKKLSKEVNKIFMKNNNFYININDDNRKFKHNLLYKLNGIKSYSNNKTKILIDEIINECELLKCNNKQLDRIPNGINGLIQEILYEHAEIDVFVENDINGDLFDMLSSKNYIMLCEILGVTLDNSIDAMKNIDSKIIYISFEDNIDSFEVIIKNTFSSQIDIDKLGTINYSSKGKGHGVGLYSILLKNSIKTKLKIVNDMFETKIIVPKLIGK